MRRFIMVLSALFALCAGPLVAEDGPAITVSGQGVITVTPDMARINIGVTQTADTAAVAMDAMAGDLAAVLDRLALAGVAPADMRSGSLQLNPQYDYQNGSEPRLTGYTASSTLQVRVFDLAALGGILDAVVQDGANQLSGLEFDVADRAPLLTAARIAAVADARAKAQTYAGAADLSLAGVRSISEGGSIARPMMMEASFADARGAVPVAAGDMTITADVVMVYALAD